MHTYKYLLNNYCVTKAFHLNTNVAGFVFMLTTRNHNLIAEQFDEILSVWVVSLLQHHVAVGSFLLTLQQTDGPRQDCVLIVFVAK
jgi:hypothetical protein